MGNYEFKQLKHASNVMFTNICSYKDDKTEFAKQEFLDSVDQVKYYSKICMNISSNEEYKLRLRNILQILTIDLQAIRNYDGDYDNDFERAADDGIYAINEICKQVEDIENTRSFSNKFKRFVEWFIPTAMELISTAVKIASLISPNSVPMIDFPKSNENKYIEKKKNYRF